jgi:hypothetical protein
MGSYIPHRITFFTLGVGKSSRRLYAVFGPSSHFGTILSEICIVTAMSLMLGKLATAKTPRRTRSVRPALLPIGFHENMCAKGENSFPDCVAIFFRSSYWPSSSLDSEGQPASSTRLPIIGDRLEFALPCHPACLYKKLPIPGRKIRGVIAKACFSRCIFQPAPF